MAFAGPHDGPPRRKPVAAGGAPARAPAAAPAGARPVRKPAPKPPWNNNFNDDKAAAAPAAAKAPAGGDYIKESLNTTLPKFKQAIHVGDRIKDRHSGRTGTCLYTGPAEFAKGKEVCGLRLDKARSTTDCDGKYRGERHFRCTPGHGLYIPLEDAEFIGIAGDEDLPQGVGNEIPRGANRDNLPANAAARRVAKAGPDGAPGTAEAAGDGAEGDFDLDEELDRIIGLDAVKEMLRSIRNSVQVAKRRSSFGVNEARNNHMVFLGNAGTGKTTIARLVARMMHNLGVLKTGQLIEVTRKDLIGSHHGETGHLTADACKRASGGVLLIDEAYALRLEGSSDSAGQECVNTLVKESEERAGELVIILAGYHKEMTTFMSSNPGLPSRFPNTFNFADYTAEEMARILKEVVVTKGFELAEDLEDAALVSLVQQNIRPGEISKGNGRLVRNMVERAIQRQTDRVFGMGTVSKGTLTTLVEADFDDERGGEPGEDSVQAVLQKLESVVGLASVKLFVRQLMAQLQLKMERKAAGLPVAAESSLHMTFLGNPGTGKTTVARIVAQMLKVLGILRLGHLVEVDRSALVAGYAGQTAIKTRQVVESALGGVLFVDEAYAIVSDERDQFGKEALDTLIKLSEDRRDDLVVILAGYSGEMQRLLAANPGLRSRFPTTIEFADYTQPELTAIADGMLGGEMLELSPGARANLEHVLATMAQVHDRENGNGRAVRNLLERAKRSQALRLMEMGGRKTKEQLVLLTEEDFADAVSEMAPRHVDGGAPPPLPPSSGGAGGADIAYAAA